MAQQRGWTMVGEYVDHGISGTTSSRPGLDRMMADARKGRFDVVAVSAFDRLARSTTHLLHTLDELQRAGVQFVSLRENIDTGGPLGRAITTIIGAIAELERSLIVERVKSGMRRAKADGKRIGRTPAAVNLEDFLHDRKKMSLTALQKKYGISRSTVCKLLRSASAQRGRKSA